MGRSPSRLPSLWLSLLYRTALPSGTAGQVVAQEGIARLEVALPALAEHVPPKVTEASGMAGVIVGVDPHKKSVTIEAVDEQE